MKLTDAFSKVNIIVIGGKRYDYSTDYRLFVEFSQCMLTGDIKRLIDFLNVNGLPNEMESVEVISNLYFPCENLSETEKVKGGVKSSNSAKFDFDILSDLIYSVFLEQYHIDLFDVCFLHFEKFRVLLACVKDKSRLKDVLMAWNCDLKKLSNKEYYLGLRKQYPLVLVSKVIKSVKERDNAMVSYLKARYSEHGM